MTERTATSLALLGLGVAALVATAVFMRREPGAPTDLRLRVPTEPARDHAGDAPPLSPARIDALRDSTLTPDAVERLRASINAALASMDPPSADASETALEYTLWLADGDVDRLLDLAIRHGASNPNRSVVERYRMLADARPDRLRPRDIEHWNDVQVIRWAMTTLTLLGRWESIGFEDITAAPVEGADAVDALFSMQPSSPGVEVGFSPMLFGRPGLATLVREGKARGVVLTVPSTSAGGDRAIHEMLLVEYEPGRWYPAGARVTSVPTASRAAEPDRAPRPR